MRLFFIILLLCWFSPFCKAEQFFTDVAPSWQRSSTLSYDEAAALFRQYYCTISSGSAVMYDLKQQRLMTAKQATEQLPELKLHWTEFQDSYQNGAEVKQPCRKDIPWQELARIFQLPETSTEEKVIIFIEPDVFVRELWKGHEALQKIDSKFRALSHYNGMKKYLVQIGTPKNR
ncbi:hypothetical protein [Rheinheimera mangrovi]|uniref:hypothetical protein n=1 Tax=Rheinheimera mangrovi TaxID=2498451 RepID=UPI000F8D5127|nr:hypothetical protein [Rheinheimera mangrovi]